MKSRKFIGSVILLLYLSTAVFADGDGDGAPPRGNANANANASNRGNSNNNNVKNNNEAETYGKSNNAEDLPGARGGWNNPKNPHYIDEIYEAYPPKGKGPQEVDPYYPSDPKQDPYYPQDPYKPDPYYPQEPYKPDPYYPNDPYYPQDPYKPDPYYPQEPHKPDPYYPTDPYKPQDPYYPTDPYKPDPYYPTDPYKPQDPYKPDPYYPQDPYKPDPYYPTDPYKPQDPYYPQDPYKPDPYYPQDPYKPDPYYPTDPYKPQDPYYPTDPYKPDPYKPHDGYKQHPYYPTDPYKPDDSYKPHDPYYPPKYPTCKEKTGNQYDWSETCNYHASSSSIACLRDTKYRSCFKYGLSVGCKDYKLNFTGDITGLRALTSFLPQKGESYPLSKNYYNPSSKDKLGSLAGNVVALALNLGIESCDDKYSSGCSKLADLLVCPSPIFLHPKKKYDYTYNDKYDDYYGYEDKYDPYYSREDSYYGDYEDAYSNYRPNSEYKYGEDLYYDDKYDPYYPDDDKYDPYYPRDDKYDPYYPTDDKYDSYYPIDDKYDPYYPTDDKYDPYYPRDDKYDPYYPRDDKYDPYYPNDDKYETYYSKDDKYEEDYSDFYAEQDRDEDEYFYSLRTNDHYDDGHKSYYGEHSYKDDKYDPYPKKDENPCRVFRGWTVKDIFKQAESALGGCCYPRDYRSATCDLKRLDKCVAYINDEFRQGKYLSYDSIFTHNKKCPIKPSKCVNCKDDYNRCTADKEIEGKCVYSYALGGCLKGYSQLSGDYLVPSVKGKAYGSAYYYLDNVNYKLYYDIVYYDLSSSLKDAFIYGPDSYGKDAVHKIEFKKGDKYYGRAKGFWTYTKKDQAHILDGSAYIVLNTEKYPKGELRGQIKF